MRRKHVPQRTCVACRQVRNKRDLVRIVRTADAGVVVDPTGKRAGRGAYLCRARACWEVALAPRSRLLDHALKMTLSDADRAALRAFAQSLPAQVGGEGVAQPPVAAGATA
jgi:predicted RNA-binding protein YlxR (DUF448 family)